MDIKTKGYFLGSIAAATYGMNPLFALPLYASGMNSDSVLFFRYLFAIPLIGLMLKVKGRSFAIQRKEILPLAILGILMAFSSLSLFGSYHYMGAGIASTLLFIYPILVALIMRIGFQEKLSKQTLFCILIALGGIALLYKGGHGTTLSFTGTLLVFASALTYAIYIVGVNGSALKNMDSLKMTFYVLVFGVMVFMIRFFMGETFVMPEPTQWMLWRNLFALALFPTAISFLCTTYSIQYIGSTPTAILGVLEPATAIFFGITVFGEELSLRESMGLVLIISAVTLVIAGGHLTAYFRQLSRPVRNAWTYFKKNE